MLRVPRWYLVGLCWPSVDGPEASADCRDIVGVRSQQHAVVLYVRGASLLLMLCSIAMLAQIDHGSKADVMACLFPFLNCLAIALLI